MVKVIKNNLLILATIVTIMFCFISMIFYGKFFWVAMMSYIVCLVIGFLEVKDNYRELKGYITIFILVAFAILYFSTPLQKCALKINFFVYDRKRTETIELIKDGKLLPDEKGTVILPKQYDNISVDGEIVVYQNDESEITIGFWYHKGLFNSGASMLVYTSSEGRMFEEKDTSERISENWYYLVKGE